MSKEQEPLVFFGSGPVAAKSLEFINQHFKVEAIITKPVTKALMTQAAPGSAIQLVQNKAELSALMASKPFKSRLGIIVDFGIIVERSVIDYFKLGIINSHFSLLPEWRGADPITFSILSGQANTGVSLMLINEKLDEGKLLAQEELLIDSAETTPSLTQKLIDLSNQMLVEQLPKYLDGHLKPYSQDLTKPVTYSRKLTKEDGLIDWQKPAVVIEREIRAYAGWPRSYTKLAGKDVIITRATVIEDKGTPGKAEVKDRNLIVYCGGGALNIEKLQPAGKKEMTSQEFLAGYSHLLGY